MNVKKIIKGILLALVVFIGALLILTTYWYARPNTSKVDTDIVPGTWEAVKDGNHNSNTDMIYWKGYFYMTHASSQWHFADEGCRIIVRRSADGKNWEKLAEISNPGQDIRDPKLMVMGDKMIMYVLKNVDFAAEPYGTSYCTSTDGKNWTEIQDIEQEGWLFWRPKTRDGHTWYMPAYWHEHGKSALFKSTDGINWTYVSQVYEGERNDETAIAFLPDGSMIATARLEVSDNYYGNKDASTLIAVAKPPYTNWSYEKSTITRLDGPYLFRYKDAVFAVGRRHVGSNTFPNYYGSIYGKKRTSIYRVYPDRLQFITDLPSAGDTTYAGVVLRGGYAWICYYTSPEQRDYPWIIGMLSKSHILMTKVPLDVLYNKSEEKKREKE